VEITCEGIHFDIRKTMTLKLIIKLLDRVDCNPCPLGHHNMDIGKHFRFSGTTGKIVVLCVIFSAIVFPLSKFSNSLAQLF
jgi:hypothetical protein